MGRVLVVLVVLIGIAMFVGVQVGQQHVEEEASAPGDPAAAPAAAPVDYALDARRSDWPPLGADAAPAALAANASAANYYVVLDGSGSMDKDDCAGDRSKMEVARTALTTFVGAVPGDANLGLAAFDGSGLSERVPLGGNNREAVLAQLARVQPKGGTPLRSAMQLAYERLTEQGRRQLGYGEYHLVMVTDGAPYPADTEDPGDVVGEILAGSPVMVHTIGFCLGTDHVLNQPGRTFYVAADSAEQLTQGLTDVLAEAPAFDATQFAH